MNYDETAFRPHATSLFAAALTALFCLTATPDLHAFESTTLEQRQRQAIELIADHPFSRENCLNDPAAGSDSKTQGCIWGQLSSGMALLYADRSEADITKGNEVLAQTLAKLSTLVLYRSKTADPNVRNSPNHKFFFLTSGLLSRTLFRFGNEPGRLTPQNRQAIAERFWDYAKSECVVADTAPGNGWRIWNTENISAMRNTTCWAAAEILSKNPVCGACQYDDGSMPSQQIVAWTRHFKELIRERATEGLFIEAYSQNYHKYTLQNFYNIAEFASDQELRTFARGLIDIWWIEWAQAQVDGRYGGSRARTHPRAITGDAVGSGMSWLYFGFDIGIKPDAKVRIPSAVRTPAVTLIVTSTYQPPAFVTELALDTKARGTFEARSRGRGLLARPAEHEYNDIAEGGIARYTFVTPSFVMGTVMVDRQPMSKWAPYSSQNRWSGLIMKGAEPTYVFARPALIAKAEHSYNDAWGVQDKATQIVQKLPPPLSRNVGSMAIWISPRAKIERDKDWLFVDATSYVAVRAAFGNILDSAGDGSPIQLSDETSPVIIQAAQKTDFATFEDFKAAVRAAPFAVDDTAVRFTGLLGAKPLTFFYRSDRLPEVAGHAIDLAPPYAFDSPFIHADWASGVVRVQVAGKSYTYDFREKGSSER